MIGLLTGATDVPRFDDVALISYAVWRSTFDRSETLVGTSVQLDGGSLRIVGVLPPSYRMPNSGITRQPDLFLPPRLRSNGWSVATARW